MSRPMTGGLGSVRYVVSKSLSTLFHSSRTASSYGPLLKAGIGGFASGVSKAIEHSLLTVANTATSGATIIKTIHDTVQTVSAGEYLDAGSKFFGGTGDALGSMWNAGVDLHSAIGGTTDAIVESAFFGWDFSHMVVDTATTASSVIQNYDSYLEPIVELGSKVISETTIAGDLWTVVEPVTDLSWELV
ncbi:MAG: hypothetical protein HRU36_03740 [Rickettsiales bacterium]|nr:hypothetical protein [Rickettsiales bacterium]